MAHVRPVRARGAALKSMKDSQLKSPQRRRFLKLGIIGGGLLFLAGFWHYLTQQEKNVASGFSFLTAEDGRVLTTLTPTLLGKALPSKDRPAAIAEILDEIDRLIAAMPALMQADLRQLFDLLGFPLTRVALTGIWSSWETASGKEVEAFLDRWSTSSLTLLQLGYAALHDLVMASWYDNPRAWPWVGYDGPPDIPDSVRKII